MTTETGGQAERGAERGTVIDVRRYRSARAVEPPVALSMRALTDFAATLGRYE
jgi:hypothetical protein